MPPFNPQFKDGKLLKTYREFERACLNNSPVFENLHLIKDTLYSIPEDCPAVSVQTLRIGVRLGTFKSGRFEPDHSLAMALTASEVNCIDVDERVALAYLNGNTFDCDIKLSGWHVVTYNGYPLGWCKAVGGVAKNHLPKGVRI